MNAPSVLSLVGILLAIAGACIATANGDLMWTALYAFLGVLAALVLRRALSWEPEDQDDEEEDEEGLETYEQPKERIGA